MEDVMKCSTIEAYDRYAPAFDEKFGRHFRNVRTKADRFIQELAGPRIVDLGSGPGNHAEYFVSQGLDVLCLDLSNAMVARCREKGLVAEVMDMEAFTLPDPVHGIWMYASLLHIPKDRASNVIERVAQNLVSGGILGLAVKEGVGEQFENHEDYPGTSRLFSYYEDEEVLRLVSPWFSLISKGRADFNGKYAFLDYLLKKRDEDAL